MREQKKIDQWNPNVDHSHRSKANSEAWNSERSMITPNGLHSLHAIHRGSWAASARRTRAWELKSEGEEERRRDGDSEIFGSDGEASLPLHLSSSRLDESEYLKRNPTADRQVQTMLALPLEEEEEGRAGLRGSNIFKRREGGDVNSISNKGEATDPTMFDMLHMVQEKQQHGNSSSALRYLPKGNKKGLVDYLQTSFPTHSSHQKEMSTQFDGIPATSGAGEDFLSEQRVRDLIMSRAAESRRKEMSRRRPFSTDESWETEDSLPPHLNRTYKRHLLRTQEAMRVYEDGAVLLQCCYRCHAARRQAAQLMRRPVHLESMYRNQIYAFAALLQSNVRCMLARLRVGRLAAEKRAKQTRDWQMRRRRAALIIQTFFVKITQHMKRMRRREDKKYGPAATCIQSAWRMRTCRRRRNDLYEHAARSVGNFCHQLRQDRTKRIQCAYRSHLARKFMTELHREHRRLLCCPGSTVWRRQGLSIGSLKQRLNLEERCVLRLQAQHMTEMTKRLSRRLIAYRCRRKEEESVMVVQSAVRCWMARVAARTMWTSCQDDWSVKLHDFSAACIQRAVLNYWSRRRLVLLRHRKLSLIQHHSAIDIQRVFAGHLARNLVRARICFLDLQQRLASSKDQLAVRLQCCVRSWQARRNVIRRVFWRDSAMAAVMIQSAARSWRARSEFNEHAMDVMGRRRCCSALVLQAWSFSNPFARQRPIARYWKKERERAAERLVGTCKMHLARRRMRERRDEVLSRAGALLLQAVFRGHVGRSTFAKVLKKEQRKEMQRAALKIQCVVRCWRAREGLKRQKMFWMEAGRLRRARELIIRSNAAKRIQAATRMWIQRHVALPPLLAQRELDAAAVLVRVYRGHTGRRDCKGRRTERRLEAVRILQCAYREHLARLMLRTAIDLSSKIPVLKEQRRRLQAAVCIQHAYFAHVARLMFVERAGDILISHARMRRLQSIYRRQQAALSIAQRAGGRMRQELLRRVVAANLLRAQVKRSLIVPKFRMQRAGMHISSFLLRNLLHRKLIFEMATSTISANLKRKFWRRRFLRYHAESRLSSFLLRSILSTRRASYRSASVHIQSVMRGHLDRRWVRANQKPLLQHRWHIRCLLALQSAYRGHVGRRKFRVLWRVREEERAIASLQAVLRRHVQRTRYWKIVDGMQKDAAITVVQQQCRRKMARRRMQQRRTEKRLNDAAERLQSVVRGHMGRKAARAWRVFLWQSTAALRVEIAYRARLGRKRLREAREERRRETAALVVQKYTRGMIGRSRARDRQWEKLEERSAKKIQTVARGMLGRKESRRRRREVELLHEFKVQQCIIIQCCIRQKIARLLLLKAEEEAAERELMRDCYATLLQCNVRMFVSRSRKERRRRAIETLQSFARMLQAKKKCRARRAILSRDSLYTPPHLLRPDRYKVPPGTQLRRPSKAAGKRFRAEATPGKIAQASSESWESRQQRAVKAFKSAPQVQAFFSDLQGRGVSRGATAERVQMKPPPAGGTGGVSQMKPPPAASMMRHSQQAATRSAPGTAMGPSKTAGRARLPPRFTKTSDGGKSSKAASASKRPKARGSDSERESGSSDEAPKPRAPVMVHRRSNYNKNDISPDPSSDSDQRGKSKGVKPLKKKSETVQPDKPKLEASRSKDAAPSRPLAATVPAPSSSAAGSKLKDLSSSKSAAEQQVEAAFMHCKLGKYREVEKALAEGLAVDTRHGPEDNTMLLTCAMNGQKRIAKLLLRNKANINATNSAGNSSLHLAYQLNYKELGDYLRSKGADDKLRNKKGLTCYEVITV
uniref:Uncharacterized protein n=2 Tax=Guillardia theta TaxID=55529 RepID=A0A7S4JV11_GUITH